MSFRLLLVAFASAVLLAPARAADAPVSYKFSFAPGAAAAGFTPVGADAVYSQERGYGFEPGAAIRAQAGFVTADPLFKFSVAVVPGNYRVTVTLGDPKGESLTTVKAETRRLMLERVRTRPGELVTRTFLVNMRTPALSPGNVLKLDTREMNPETHEAVTATWDDKLTLQFSDAHPALVSLELTKVEDAITVFIIGDSTVTDQAGEPTGTWGQTLPRWLKPPVVVANHAESGETLKAFRMQNRWFKVMSEMKPGDYVFMQFGHNDPKTSGHDRMWPDDDTMGDWANTGSEADTEYKWLLASYAVEVKRRGGIPVIVSPMTRINMTTGALNPESLSGYPKAALEAARLAGVASIDLHAMSLLVGAALGPKLAPLSSADGTHSNTYGGYLLSRCIVEGIRQAKLGLADYLVDDAGSFDPRHPQPMPEDFKLPPDPRLPPMPTAGHRAPPAAAK